MKRRTMLSAITAGLLATAGEETFTGLNGTTLSKIGQKAPSWMGLKKTKKYKSRCLKRRVSHSRSNRRRNAKQLREAWLEVA